MKAVHAILCVGIFACLLSSAQAQPFRGQAPKKNQPQNNQPVNPLQNRVQPITQGNPPSNITLAPSVNNQFLPQANQFNNMYNGYQMNPYATPFSPYQTTPIMNPNPYAPSLVNPAFNPYQNQYPLTPFNNMLPGQQLFPQQNPLNPYNQFPVNPYLQNNFAPVVGIGR